MVEWDPALLTKATDGTKVKYPFVLEEPQKALPAWQNFCQRPGRKG